MPRTGWLICLAASVANSDKMPLEPEMHIRPLGSAGRRAETRGACGVAACEAPRVIPRARRW